MEVSFERKSPEVPASSAAVIDVQATPAEAPAVTAPIAPATEIPATAVARVETPSVPAVVDSPAAFDDENIGFEDIILPRINIVQKVGDLSNVFTPGEIVLNQQVVIHEPAIPAAKRTTSLLVITILGFKRKQYTEKVEGTSSVCS
jgi:hypothetical protein